MSARGRLHAGNLPACPPSIADFDRAAAQTFANGPVPNVQPAAARSSTAQAGQNHGRFELMVSLGKLASKFFGSSNDRRVKGYQSRVDAITALEPQMEAMAFDVQLIGGMVLHQGKIAEMKTGEGKTLVATLPSISTR
jgi:hypothetical protein